MDDIQEPRFTEDDLVKRGWFSSVFQWVQRQTKIVVVTANYTVAYDVRRVRADATGGAFTITLPASLDWGGRPISAIKTDSSGNAVTIARSGSDKINGGNSQSLAAQYSAITVVADGTTNWDIF